MGDGGILLASNLQPPGDSTMPPRKTKGLLEQERRLNEAIATRLRELLVRHRLSVRALARDLGLSASMLSAVTNGHRRPSLSNLIALADRLDVTHDELVGRTSAPRRRDVRRRRA